MGSPKWDESIVRKIFFELRFSRFNLNFFLIEISRQRIIPNLWLCPELSLLLSMCTCTSVLLPYFRAQKHMCYYPNTSTLSIISTHACKWTKIDHWFLSTGRFLDPPIRHREGICMNWRKKKIQETKQLQAHMLVSKLKWCGDFIQDTAFSHMSTRAFEWEVRK